MGSRGTLPNQYMNDLRDTDNRPKPKARFKPKAGVSTPKVHIIERLYDRHHEIVRRIVLGQGCAQIAKDLGMSLAMVKEVKNSPIAKDKIAMLQAVRDASTMDLSKQIEELGLKAFENVREAITKGTVLDKNISGVQVLKESNGMLDRSLGKATLSIETKNTHIHFDASQIAEIKRKAIERGASQGLIVDLSSSETL